ncbi:MAG: cell division protein ZapA [Pseudomonadota bacterium]
MSTVNITIGPRTYPVACGDGEEAHVEKLAAVIDQKYAQLGAARTARESQNLLFTALFLADELAEAKKGNIAPSEPEKPSGKKAELKAEIDDLRSQNEALKSELEQLRKAASTQTDLYSGDTADTDAIAEKIEALAARAEATADALEGVGTDA